MEEPSVKRPRSEPEEPVHSLGYKSILVDLENYGEWVRKLSDDELLSVFELGFKVREAVFFSVDVNREIMDKALASQMKPTYSHSCRDHRGGSDTPSASGTRECKSGC